MANFDRQYSFRKWAPDIGDNRERETPGLWFELATGLAEAQLKAISGRVTKALEDMRGKDSVAEVKAIQCAAYSEAFGPYVRVIDGPHSIAGMPLATLADYIGIVQQQADFGTTALNDLHAAVNRFNSFSGPDELFLLRRSGGSRSTARPSVVTVTAAKPKKKGR